MTIYTSHLEHFTPQHTAFEQFWFDTVCNIVTRWVTFRENHLHDPELQLSDYKI